MAARRGAARDARLRCLPGTLPASSERVQREQPQELAALPELSSEEAGAARGSWLAVLLRGLQVQRHDAAVRQREFATEAPS
jgi:hypothetical protein